MLTEKSSNMSSNPTARVSPSQRTPRRSMSGMESDARTHTKAKNVTTTCGKQPSSVSAHTCSIFSLFPHNCPPLLLQTAALPWSQCQDDASVFAVPSSVNLTGSLCASSPSSSLMFSAGCMWTGVSCMALRLSFWPCRKASMRLFLNTCSNPSMRKNWR